MQADLANWRPSVVLETKTVRELVEMRMKAGRHPRRLLATVLLAAAIPSVSRAQVILKVGDTAFFRLVLQVQGWADWMQSAAAGTSPGYSRNLFLRRARLLLTGQVAPDVTFYFQTDSPNLGKATGAAANPKGFSPGFLIQDAWFEWKLADAFAVDAGEMYVPFSRNELTSSSSLLTLESSPLSSLFATATQTNSQRDTGFQARGYLAGGHFEYRVGAFQGSRQAGSRNAPLVAGYLQYDLLDTEKGYTFAGTNLGKKRVLALSAGFETQHEYRAYSGDILATLPVRHGDEVAGELQWTHFDDDSVPPSILNQNGYLGELGYYIAAARLQPFAKYESQRFVDNAARSNDMKRWGAGFNYYLHGQNLKLTGQYLRTLPNSVLTRNTNEFTLQVQVFYF